jgi:hypothetical protein
MRRAAIGISAHLGWAATAIVTLGKPGLRVLRTDRLEIADPDDRQAKEPYHVAGGFEGLERVARPADPEAALKTGLQRQRRSTVRVTREVESALASSGHRVAFVGILASRGRPAATFEQAIGSHTQIHIEEGIAVRESFRLALARDGRRIEMLDQKSIWSTCSEEFARPEEDLLAELSALRPVNEGPWRKEEKIAALAAWLAWVRGTRPAHAPR